MPAKKVLITLTEGLQRELDEKVKQGRFVSRSEVIREAVRKFLGEINLADLKVLQETDLNKNVS